MRLFRAKRPRTLFFFHETTWSGAPIQLLHLITWLKGKGWDVAAAVPKTSLPESGPITARLTSMGVETFPVLDLSQLPDLPALRDLCRQFEVIVANTLVMWAAVRAAHEAGRASIWYIHESLVSRYLLEQIPEIQPTLALAQTLVMPTRRTAGLYKSYVARPIEVVPYGIPTGKEAAAGSGNEYPTFLLLGTYEPRKGQDIFQAAIDQIPVPLGERARFQMAGRKLDPEYYDRLAAWAGTLPNVELRPALEHIQAQAAIAAADVLVCASRDETMPVAILEAMSLGKTIVTTEVGGITEWLQDGTDALVVRPEDPVALSQALQRCLAEPELREKLSTNARRTVSKNFSLDRLGKRFSGLIRSALRQQKQ